MDNINLDKIFRSEELDYNMILSVPEEIGLKLQNIIQGQASQNEKDSTNIEIIQNINDKINIEDSRKLVFKLNDTILPVTILDLPCIIEANKTIDYKSFYKSSDISQMMFVHNEDFKLKNVEDIDKFDPFKANDPNFGKIVWKKDYDHKFKCKNGLSKCTKNIRARRFKKKHKYNSEQIFEVTKKLKNIIDNGTIEKKTKESNIEDPSNVENQSIYSQSKSKFTEK